MQMIEYYKSIIKRIWFVNEKENNNLLSAKILIKSMLHIDNNNIDNKFSKLHNPINFYLYCYYQYYFFLILFLLFFRFCNNFQ